MNKNLCSRLGIILQHLLTIDFLMRQVIDKKGEKNELCVYFSDVRTKYNQLAGKEIIPEDILTLRNAFAHGFITFSEPNSNSIGTLIKYKKKKKTIEFQADLDEKWLKTKINETRDILIKVNSMLESIS